jgi:site-specific recombinase XerD
MSAYEQAKASAVPLSIGSNRTLPGTVNAALVNYYQSTAFSGLAKSTRSSRRAILERFRADHGDKRIALMPAVALQRIVNGRTAAAQRNFVKAMRGLIEHCLSFGMIKDDPLIGLKLAKAKRSGGFHTWSEEEIERYRARHAPGTKARLALELLLNTGHARSDVTRMGSQHVKNGKLSMRRQKTSVQFDIPLLPDLSAELALHTSSGSNVELLAFLVTDQGKPFTAAGFGNWFANRCAEAGVPGRAHGLRKASAVRHALNGATAFELMAWHGWKTIGEAQRYAEEANRIKLAESAGAKVITGTGVGSPADPVSQIERQVVGNTGAGK